MGENEKILVIDDHEMMRTALKKGLEERGFKVIAAIDSVGSVITFLENGGTDVTVALIDNRMPDEGDGEKAASLIRTSIPGVKIISHAGRPQNWGDVDLPKGTTLKEISETIRSL